MEFINIFKRMDGIEETDGGGGGGGGGISYISNITGSTTS